MDPYEREELAKSIAQEIAKSDLAKEIAKSDLAKEIAKEIELARTARKEKEIDLKASRYRSTWLSIKVLAVIFGIIWVGLWIGAILLG